MSPCATITQSILDRLHNEPERSFCYLKTAGADHFQTVSYRQLTTDARCYLRSYQTLQINQGAPILIIMEHGLPMIHAFIGALLGGYIPSFLAPPGERQNPQHYWEQLQQQCEHIGGALLVTSSQHQQALLSIAGMADTPVLNCDQVATDPENATIYAAQPGDIALLQHSSGTTGSRKGVALSHQEIIQQISRYADTLHLNDQDVIASWLPLYHDMGLISSFLLPLLAGIPVVLISPFEWVNQPRLLLDAIQNYRATLVWLPNFAFHLLARLRLEQAPADLSSLRAVINCSEPCKKEAFDTFAAQFGRYGVTSDKLQICYAMAEMVFAATQTAIGAPVQPFTVSRSQLHDGRLVPGSGSDCVTLMPVGRPLADVTVRIIDELGHDLPDGQVGEIVLSAPFLFSGYYKNPALTKEALGPTGYRTGDLGACWQGDVYVTGRKKDLIIVNGRNYYAHDIEAIASSVSGVKPGRCVALGLYHEALGSETVCLIAESDQTDHKALAVSIKSAIQQNMGIIITKAVIVPPKWLIKTTSGKISRKDNKEKYLASLAMLPITKP